MKLVESILLFLFAAICVLCGYFIGERVVQFSPPAGKVLVSQNFIDSLRSLKPQVVVRDRFIFEEKVVYRDRPVPVPVPISPEINEYVDSLINDSTWIVIKDRIAGELLHRDLNVRRSVVLREINTPYPVIVDREVYLPAVVRNQFYGQALVGGNSQRFLMGAQLGIINKRNTMLSGMVLTDFNEPIYGAGIGKTF